MHLHSLTFQAVGPFPGRHRIDLATLAKEINLCPNVVGKVGAGRDL